MVIRPMLATSQNCDPTKIKYPKLVSYKLDGVRCLITDEGPRSRSGKPFPNKHVMSLLSTLPVGLDGELGVINPETGSLDFRATTSAVMSIEGEPDVRYFVFDDFSDPTYPYASPARASGRGDNLSFIVADLCPPWVQVLEQRTVNSPDEVWAMFEEAIGLGHEGLILRDPTAPYKFGRATLKAEALLKLKPWVDTEARVIGVTEEFENTNEKFRSELGYGKRSSALAGKVGKGRLGNLICSSPTFKDSFEIGTGFTEQDRIDLWSQDLIGRLVKFKYLDCGAYDKPRSAVFLGFRAEEDTDDA